jgi:hypothetical protein
MRKSILVALLLSLFIGIAGEASAQLDCTTLIKRLNNTVKAPGAFDVEFFIGKYGLDHASCPEPRGAVYCFRCQDETKTRSVEIVISKNGRIVSDPNYVCRCGKDVKWKQAP